MEKEIVGFGKHSIVYGIGNALTIAASFILIPLYTNVLSPHDYGMLEILNRTADIFMLIVLGGFRQAYIRFFLENSDDIEWRKKVTSTTIFFLIIFSSVSCVIFAPLTTTVSQLLFNDSRQGYLFSFLLLWLPFEVLFNIGLAYLQVSLKSLLFITVSSIKLVMIITSNLVLVYYLQKGVAGVLVTNIWVAAIFSLIFLVFFVLWTRCKVDLNILKSLIGFSLPYIPAAFFMFLINNADRYLLIHFVSTDAVGIYALAFKIGMFGTSLVLEPFTRVWSPFLYQNYSRHDGPELVSRVALIFLLISSFIALAISISAPIVIPFLSGEKFHSSYRLIPIICIASTFYSIALIADAGILITKKTYYKPFILAASACVSILLNIILVPRFNEFGSAWALTGTFVTIFLLNYNIGRRYFKLTLDPKKFVSIIFAAFLTYFCANSFFKYAYPNKALQALSLLTIILYPSTLYVTGFFSSDTRAIFGHLFKSLFRKIRG